MTQGTLKPFLVRSAAAHAALLVLAPLLLKNGLSRGEQVYRIDFIGATDAIVNRDVGGMRAPLPKPRTDLGGSAARPEAMTDPDAFDLSGKARSSLPKPSILSQQPSAAAVPATPASVPSPAAGEGEGPGASVAAEMPDFPYPWYLSQIRGALWDNWSARMPPGRTECVVFFSILRDGTMADLRVESSSGSEEHDYAALSAVQAAAPFPPLPRGMAEKFLKVHVSFRSR